MVTEPTSSGDHIDLKNIPSLSGFGRIDSELKDIRQKGRYGDSTRPHSTYENIEGIWLTRYGKKAIVTPVTSSDFRRLVGCLHWDRRVGALRTPQITLCCPVRQRWRL